MKRITLIFFLFTLLPILSFAKDNPDDVEFEYQIEGAGTGSQGTYLVQVWVMCNKPKVTDKELGKYAVKGVLFKGFSSKEYRQNQKPIAGSPMAEMEHRDFFIDFFREGGAYSNYIQIISNSRKVVKLGPKEYKVGVTVTVLKDLLIKDLEKVGVIKGLNSGF